MLLHGCFKKWRKMCKIHILLSQEFLSLTENTPLRSSPLHEAAERWRESLRLSLQLAGALREKALSDLLSTCTFAKCKATSQSSRLLAVSLAEREKKPEILEKYE